MAQRRPWGIIPLSGMSASQQQATFRYSLPPFSLSEVEGHGIALAA